MTKLELMEMLKNVDDNANLTFVVDGSDYNGYPEDKIAKVYKVLDGKAVKVKGKNGIYRYESLTDDIEYVAQKNMYGIEIGYYQRKEA